MAREGSSFAPRPSRGLHLRGHARDGSLALHEADEYGYRRQLHHSLGALTAAFSCPCQRRARAHHSTDVTLNMCPPRDACTAVSAGVGKNWRGKKNLPHTLYWLHPFSPYRRNKITTKVNLRDLLANPRTGVMAGQARNTTPREKYNLLTPTAPPLAQKKLQVTPSMPGQIIRGQVTHSHALPLETLHCTNKQMQPKTLMLLYGRAPYALEPRQHGPPHP